MFDNFKGMMGLMGQAKEIRERMERVQRELEQKTVEGNAGAGAVRVTVNGKFEVMRVDLDPIMIQTLAAPTPVPAAEPEQAQDDATDAQSQAVASLGVSSEDRKMVEDLIAAAMNDAMSRARSLVQEEMAKASEGLDIPGLENMIKQFSS